MLLVRVRVTPWPWYLTQGWESSLSSAHKTWDQSVSRVESHTEDTFRSQSMGMV